MKSCKKCGVSKCLEEYRLLKTAKDGHRNVCKVCMNTVDSFNYATNSKRRATVIAANTKTKATSSKEEWKIHLKRNRLHYRKMINNPITKQVYLQKQLVKDKLIREELDDKYIKKLLTRGTSLKFEDIPESLVEVKREHIKVRRLLY